MVKSTLTWGLLVLFFIQPGNGGNDLISDCNVVWDSPSKNSWGSMPIGNGDIGLNVWVEENGDLLFYIGKTDAWSENARLLKLGRIRVGVDPNPFKKGTTFRQELRLREGEIRIETLRDFMREAVEIGTSTDAQLRASLQTRGKSTLSAGSDPRTRSRRESATSCGR